MGGFGRPFRLSAAPGQRSEQLVLEMQKSPGLPPPMIRCFLRTECPRKAGVRQPGTGAEEKKPTQDAEDGGDVSLPGKPDRTREQSDRGGHREQHPESDAPGSGGEAERFWLSRFQAGESRWLDHVDRGRHGFSVGREEPGGRSSATMGVTSPDPL